MVLWRINCVLSCETNVDLANQRSCTQKATAMTVRDNKSLSRFERDVEGAIAFANYRRTPGSVIITHTETPRAMGGRGIASELIRADGDKSSPAAVL
jgi:hypothetical protein